MEQNIDRCIIVACVYITGNSRYGPLHNVIATELFLLGVMEEERRGTFKRAESFIVKIGSPTDSTLPFSDLG